MWLPELSATPPAFSWHFAWKSLPVFIKICLLIALAAMLGAALAMISITVRRNALQKQEALMEQLARQVNELLLNTIVLSPTPKGRSMVRADFDTSGFYKLGLSVKKVNQVLVEEMIHYRNYFSGTIAEQIRKLYLGLSLHKAALLRLQKKSWESRSNALAELFKMDIEVPRERLQELLRSDNRYIREYARLMLIKFSKADPLAVLFELDEPLSQWEQLEIFLLVKDRADITAAALQKLLPPANSQAGLNMLAVKLAIHFHLRQALPGLLLLADATDPRLRTEAILAIGLLGNTQSQQYLRDAYSWQTHEGRLAIIRALGQIQNSRHMRFLENEFLYSDDFETKKYAAEALIRLYPLSKATVDRLAGNTEPENQVILQHSLDPLINAS